MSPFQDAPAWLIELARGTWGEPEWRAWERWKVELAKRGVTPDMLSAVGDPTRPDAITAPARRTCQGRVSWDDPRTAVLDALRLLVADLDKASSPS
jgi:hypothetical protein